MGHLDAKRADWSRTHAVLLLKFTNYLNFERDQRYLDRLHEMLVDTETKHHLGGKTVFQSFFMSTMIQPLASA